MPDINDLSSKLLKINPVKPEKKKILKAAQTLKRGGLVIFPTETVYGLGANALNTKAVRKVFKVKNRPINKPLILLIARKSDLKKLVQTIPGGARKVIKAFWPGPLTLIFRAKSNIPKEVTAGGETVAIRLSSNHVVKALIKAAGVPLTAPSANISGNKAQSFVSPAIMAFKKRSEIDLILDAGKTQGGISTILDLTKNPPVILREGNISKSRLRKIIPEVK